MCQLFSAVLIPWFSLHLCSQTDGGNKEKVSNVPARCSLWFVQAYCVLNVFTSKIEASGPFPFPVVTGLYLYRNTRDKAAGGNNRQLSLMWIQRRAVLHLVEWV